MQVVLPRQARAHDGLDQIQKGQLALRTLVVDHGHARRNVHALRIRSHWQGSSASGIGRFRWPLGKERLREGQVRGFAAAAQLCRRADAGNVHAAAHTDADRGLLSLRRHTNNVAPGRLQDQAGLRGVAHVVLLNHEDADIRAEDVLDDAHHVEVCLVCSAGQVGKVLQDKRVRHADVRSLVRAGGLALVQACCRRGRGRRLSFRLSDPAENLCVPKKTLAPIPAASDAEEQERGPAAIRVVSCELSTGAEQPRLPHTVRQQGRLIARLVGRLATRVPNPFRRAGGEVKHGHRGLHRHAEHALHHAFPKSFQALLLRSAIRRQQDAAHAVHEAPSQLAGAEVETLRHAASLDNLRSLASLPEVGIQR
mmetsp:Transcript_14879/g.56386  ORF Transcript_14879/g.56386 Transcript_14879/m.56386 type:complete len:367 (-) Transcript_14879:2934-4034(-)